MGSDCCNISTHISNESLEGSPRSEIPSPIAVIAIGVREEIVILGGINIGFLVDSFEVLSRCSIVDSNAKLWSSIDVLKKLIDILVPHACVGIVKVLSESMEKVARAIVEGLILKVLHKLLRFINKVVIVQSRIVSDWLVSAIVIETESWRRAIMVVVDMGEDVVIDS